MVSYRKPGRYAVGGAVPSAPLDSPVPLPLPDAGESPPVASVDVSPQPAANPLHEEIDRIPGLSDAKRDFFKAHPETLAHPNALQFYYSSALNAGIPDDSPQMFEAVLAGCRREQQFAVENALGAAMRISPNADRATPTAIAAQKRADVAIDRAREIIGEPSVRPQPQRGKSLPISAPVSRDVPMPSGGRMSMNARYNPNNSLTAEERDIARRSFTAPDLTDAQREYLYWQNREKLRRMRADGTYRMTTEQGG
jgi:hypothetical protein